MKGNNLIKILSALYFQLLVGITFLYRKRNSCKSLYIHVLFKINELNRTFSFIYLNTLN